MMTPAQQEALRRWREKRVRYSVELNPDKDADIMEYLERPDVKKQAAIKAGLRLLMMVDQENKKEKP